MSAINSGIIGMGSHGQVHCPRRVALRRASGTFGMNLQQARARLIWQLETCGPRCKFYEVAPPSPVGKTGCQLNKTKTRPAGVSNASYMSNEYIATHERNIRAWLKKSSVPPKSREKRQAHQMGGRGNSGQVASRRLNAV
jgi:hypothetical protein